MDIWTYRVLEADADIDFTGFVVEAADGPVGTVDGATFGRGSSYLVVLTSTWRGDQRQMLPASVVSRVDVHERRLCVDVNRDRIRDAPPWNATRVSLDAYRRAVAAHFGSG